MMPTELPTDSIKIIVDILRKKEISERKSDFAYHVWLLTGYVLQKAFPRNLVGTIDLTEQQVIDSLDRLVLPEGNTAGFAEDIIMPMIIKWLIETLLSN